MKDHGNLRDPVDIVTALQARDIGVKSLTDGIVDTTTPTANSSSACSPSAEYEAALIQERTVVGLAAARARGRRGGRKPKMIPELVGKANGGMTSGSSPGPRSPPPAASPP